MRIGKIVLAILLGPVTLQSISFVNAGPENIDEKTVKEWSEPFRNWHYHPGLVIPPDPGIKGFEKIKMTDVPTVFQISGDDKWYMTYIGFDGSGYQSFIAESEDLVHWGNHRLAMGYGPEGGFDYGGVVLGAYLYEDYGIKSPRTLKRKKGSYYSLYGAYPRQGGYELRPGYEGLALSGDGFTWQRANDEPILSVHQEDCGTWEKDCIYQPWLLEHKEKYYNFYNAANGHVEQTGVALSEDLLEWSRYENNPVIPNGPEGSYNEKFSSDSKVFWDRDHWVNLFFGVGQGGAHIMVAFSRDLYHWTVDPDPIYKAGGNPSGIDAKYAHKISLVWNPEQESYYMFYCAVDQNNQRGIGLITSKQIDQYEWQSLQTLEEDGLLGERVDLWRNKRLWNIAESGYLIDGFENRPGIHPWQGEHLGKWLHAATIACKITGDEKIKEALDEMVERLLATQLPDGYLGTYAEEDRFMNVMGSQDPDLLADDIEPLEKKDAIAAWNQQKGGWDTWTFRYNIYGLLSYERYFPDDKIVNACKRMTDLLIYTYGVEKYDLTQYGSRKGISATTLLESVMMLYERTLEKKYLDFAEEIVTMSENNPSLRLMGTMLDGGSVVYPGDGKGYQLMANLLGYIRLYKATGNEKYLQTVLHAWEEIKAKHLLVNGGPWSRKMPYNGNNECFAHVDAFHPEKINVEGCCDATWILLNTLLFELTGNAKYFNEAEVTLINDVYQHQHIDGIQWCYMTVPNQERPKYESRFHCCASSEPRALEMYSDHLCGIIGENLSVNTLFPSTIQLSDQFGGGTLTIKGNFPFESSADICLETMKKKAFTLEFRLPANASLKSVSVNGKKFKTVQNENGFIEIDRRWEKGDVVSVALDYKLVAHFQDGEEGGKWIAFTYGPFALSQKIDKMPDEEPFRDSGIEESQEVIHSLVKSRDSNLEFTIKGTNITLIPYYQTGSEQSGSRTYFEL